MGLTRRDAVLLVSVFLCGIALCILVSWYIFSSTSLVFCINEASLTQFNLTNNNTLDYKFKVNISVKNRNYEGNVIAYYYDISAIAWYKDNDFGMVGFAPFQQGHHETTFLDAVFEGHSVMKLKPKQLDEYYKETLVGVYNDLAVDLVLKSSHWRFGSVTLQFHRLSFPLIGNGELASPFKSCQKRF